MNRSISKLFSLPDLKIVPMILVLSLGIGPVFADAVLYDDSAQTTEDTPVTMNVFDNDTTLPGEYQAMIGSQPASGTASVNPDWANRRSTHPGFTRSDSFYLVNPFIDPTTANDDILVMFRDTPKTIDLLRNDFDPQGAPLDVTIQTLPSHGTVVENLDETIAYTSSSGFTGSDSFTYQIDDGNDHTDTTIVNLSVQAVNAAYMSHYLAPRPQTGNIDDGGTPINLRITTLNSSGATGTVSFPGSSEPDHSFTIAQHETFQLYLDTSTAPPPGGGPDLGITHQYNTIENNGIKVTADTAVDVQITQDTSCWQSFLQSKGLTALGTNFYAGQMYGERYFLVPDDPGGFITVIATEDNTQVTFDVPPGATWNWQGTSQQIITVALDTGQTYAVSAGFNGEIPNDLTGAHVTASKPIAVNSGAFGVYIPTHAGDHGWDQLVPVERIGAEYVIIKGSSTTERVDVVATQDGTDISVNGTTVATNLPAGGRYQFTPGGGANTPTLIETTKPAYVYQSSGSSHGENGMSLIPPIRTEGIGRVRFRAADSSTIIRAVLSTAALNTLQLTDITGGGPIIVPINIGGASPVPGRPDLSIVQVDVTTGHEFIIGADSFIQATLTSFSPERGGGGGFSALSGFNVEADLAITKTDSPDDPVIAGNNLTYTLTVLNHGSSDATGVTLTDTLPSGVSFVSAIPSQGTGCNGTSPVICDLGSLANGTTATVTILVTPTITGTITNTASVMSNNFDPNPANNTATENTTVTSTETADLAVTQTDSPDSVTVGNNLTYTVLVANNGPSEATEVTLTDTLPSNVTFVSATNCTETDGIVTCNLGSLANGASDTVTILVIPTMTGTITNTANVMGNKSDPNLANNTATENTMVVNVPIEPKVTPTVVPDASPASKEDGPPIPEPTTITLVGLGLAGLVAYVRHRHRRK